MLTHVLQTLKQLYKCLVPELPERNCSVDCVLMPLHTDIYPNLRFSKLSSNSLPTSNLVSHQSLWRSMSHNAVCNYCMFSWTLGLLLPRQGNYSLVHRNNLKLSMSLMCILDWSRLERNMGTQNRNLFSVRWQWVLNTATVVIIATDENI